MKRRTDYVLEFRFPGDDWFTHRETNVIASGKREAFELVKAHLPEIEFVDAFPGIVMLYGAPYCTIDESRPRYEQTKMPEFKKGKRRK